MKKILYTIIILLLLAIAFFYGLKIFDNFMSQKYSTKIYDNIDKIPPKKAALVLGTAKYAMGRENLFFNARIDAAVKLYKAGKVRAIVVSGDNGKESYDEPTDMRDDLIQRGVPKEFITLDYAGFSTLDSVIRASAIFDLDDFIVVSQRFHCQRALYIADIKGLKAIGFAAADVHGFWNKKIMARETLARFKAFLDLNIFGTEPKYYGKKERVNYK
jgi:SanA protein